MNASQTRMIILVIQTVDWLLVFALAGYLAVAYHKSYSPNTTMTIAIVGLLLIHQFGRWSITKIAYLRQTLKRTETIPHVR